MRVPLEASIRELELSARDSLCDWLTSIPWDWYVTNTFSQDVSIKQGDKKWFTWFDSCRKTDWLALNTGKKEIRITGKGAPYYWRVSERQKQGRLHYHALIGGVGDLRRLSYKDLWEPHGFARVVEYNSELGAGAYLAKYLSKELNCGEQFAFSNNLKYYLK